MCKCLVSSFVLYARYITIKLAPIRLKYIISYSSQDSRHPAENLLLDDGVHKWLSSTDDKTRCLTAEIQLERTCVITHIDVGTVWTFTVQIDVGRSSWPKSKDYVSLLPSSTFTNPADSKSGKNKDIVRMFKQEHFTDAKLESWDRIRISCTQPFRKDQFGLRFLRITAEGDEIAENTQVNCTDDTVPVKIKSVESIQEHFFGKTVSSSNNLQPLKDKLTKLSSIGSSEGALVAPLGRTAQMVVSALEASPRYLQPVTGSRSPRVLKAADGNRHKLEFEDEAKAFLDSLEPAEMDLEKITIADLRHQLERKKMCKLSHEEKKKFFEIAADHFNKKPLVSAESSCTQIWSGATQETREGSKKSVTDSRLTPSNGSLGNCLSSPLPAAGNRVSPVSLSSPAPLSLLPGNKTNSCSTHLVIPSPVTCAYNSPSQHCMQRSSSIVVLSDSDDLPDIPNSSTFNSGDTYSSTDKTSAVSLQCVNGIDASATSNFSSVTVKNNNNDFDVSMLSVRMPGKKRKISGRFQTALDSLWDDRETDISSVEQSVAMTNSLNNGAKKKRSKKFQSVLDTLWCNTDSDLSANNSLLVCSASVSKAVNLTNVDCDAETTRSPNRKSTLASCGDQQSLNNSKKAAANVAKVNAHSTVNGKQQALTSISSSVQSATCGNSNRLADITAFAHDDVLMECLTCGDMITRQFFARHASQCSAQASESSCEREDQCPICGLSYPISILPLHASNCGL